MISALLDTIGALGILASLAVKLAGARHAHHTGGVSTKTGCCSAHAEKARRLG